jgi:hypothetical protein
VDKARRQAHALDRSNVFIANKKMVTVWSLSDLDELAPPSPDWTESAHAIAVEDNSVIPLLPFKEPVPIELVERTVDLHMAIEENKAPLDAERDDGKLDGLVRTYRIVALAFLFLVFGGLVLAGVVFLMKSGFEVGATSMVALGAVSVARRESWAFVKDQVDVLERVLVIAYPRSYFILMPRQLLLDTYKAEARFIPSANLTVWRWGTALALGGALYAGLLGPSLLLLPLNTALTVDLLLGFLLAAWFRAQGFDRFMLPRMYNLQSLWCLLRVEKEVVYEPVYDSFDDGEGNTVRVLVDVTHSLVDKEKIEFVPLNPRALLLEARPTGESEDKGIQRADYFYEALNPSDVREWFKQTTSALGMPDALIGGGYLLAALGAIFMFVTASGGL